MAFVLRNRSSFGFHSGRHASRVVTSGLHHVRMTAQRWRGLGSSRAGGNPPACSRRNIARADFSTRWHAPAPAPTAVPQATAHMIAAPIAPPNDTGNSNPNNSPPDKIAIGGAKISLAARRVGASDCQSASHAAQRSPSAKAWRAQRVVVHRPHFMTGAAMQSGHARVLIPKDAPVSTTGQRRPSNLLKLQGNRI
jgi:hypothetical protein